MPRYWTVAEARAALPRAIEMLHELRQAVAEIRSERSAASAGGGPRAVPGSSTPSINGHGRASAAVPAEQRVQQLAVRFKEMGILIKDMDGGLIDFPYLRDGEEVLLCYRLGEPDLEYWHELETGFAGRRPLSEL